MQQPTVPFQNPYEGTATVCKVDRRWKCWAPSRKAWVSILPLCLMVTLGFSSLVPMQSSLAWESSYNYKGYGGSYSYYARPSTPRCPVQTIPQPKALSFCLNFSYRSALSRVFPVRYFTTFANFPSSPPESASFFLFFPSFKCRKPQLSVDALRP